MQSDIVSTIFLPASLAFIMLSLGLGLTPADFRRIVAQPRALLLQRRARGFAAPVGLECKFQLPPRAHARKAEVVDGGHVPLPLNDEWAHRRQRGP